MSFTSTYLNFARETEAAFEFYKSIFWWEYEGDIFRWGKMPPIESMPPVDEEDKHLIMHICLPITWGHRLMGSDILEAMGSVQKGNNVNISLHPDSREEADRLFTRLSEWGTVGMPLADQFWGDYYWDCTDKFGIKWMVNYNPDYV